MAIVPARRTLISLVWVDGAAIGLWLWALNRIVFHRPLVWHDYVWVSGLSVACAAASRRYAVRRVPLLRLMLEMMGAQILLVAALCLLQMAGGLPLSPRQAIKLAALQLPLLALTRLLEGKSKPSPAGISFESTRLLIVVAAGVALTSVFVTDGWVGGGDAYWYDNMLADFVSQWRAGIFPVFIGQSEFAFNGAVSPLRFAPYFQHFAGLLDLVTGHALGFFALQNLTLALALIGGGLSAYLCAAAILPQSRWTALGLALLYMACPATMALFYTGNLIMSIMTLPYLPMSAYGLWRWWSEPAKETPGTRLTAASWLALPLAASWWCHPPIALWLTVVVLVMGALRLAWNWRDRHVWLKAATAAGLFVLTAGYVFISVVTLATPPTTPIDRMSIVRSIEAAVPAAFLPVTPSALQFSDYQLGWGLWTVVLLAAGYGAFRRRRNLAALLGAIALLLLFVLPFPVINRWLWLTALPQALCNITFTWAVQRFYVILAAFAAIAGAAGLAASSSRSTWSRLALALGLGAGVAWSGWEAAKFVRHGPSMTATPAAAALTHGIHNIFLTRYAFSIFLPVPGYFSHGYVDPYLENRILAADLHTVIASNLAFVRPSAGASFISLTADYHPADRSIIPSPRFRIAPGVRYAARLELHVPRLPGAFLAEGERTEREYFLPDSSYGMIHEVPTHSFGFTPTSSDFFSLWTSPPLADNIQLVYALNDPVPASLPADFGRLYLQPYAIEDLPVKVSSWMPYRATTEVPAEGAWLETPRLYVPGYVATVNGLPAALRCSPDGLVAIALQPGDNQVLLRYPGPWSLQASYWIALLTWAGIIGVLIRNAIRRRLRSAAA